MSAALFSHFLLFFRNSSDLFPITADLGCSEPPQAKGFPGLHWGAMDGGPWQTAAPPPRAALLPYRSPFLPFKNVRGDARRQVDPREICCFRRAAAERLVASRPSDPPLSSLFPGFFFLPPIF